jgi:hypothetical protein
MNISKEWLKEQDACQPGLEWFEKEYLGIEVDHNTLIKRLCDFNLGWAFWLAGKRLSWKGRTKV